MTDGRPPASLATTLVIGYGNTLRADDGVGQRVAVAISAWDLPGVSSRAMHQLTPELAEPLSTADLAVFVDARLAEGGDVLLSPLEPSATGGMMGHVCDPRSLLGLTRAMYGRHPRAWLVSVPAADFSLGEGLSATAAHGAADALERITALIEAAQKFRSSDERFQLPARQARA
jgi:hydrogenase maturation protease